MMNGAFALAFSAPLARLFGPKVEGALLFFAFYVLCRRAREPGLSRRCIRAARRWWSAPPARSRA